MVMLSNNSQTVPDAVCPHCFKPLTTVNMLDDDTDQYGRRLRMYVSHCFKCETGFEVIQFMRDGRWILHKYRDYRYLANVHQRPGEWVLIHELPEPAPVITGPGGDYVKLREIQCNTIQNAIGALDAIKKALIELLKYAK